MEKTKILMVLGNTGRGGSQSYAMNILRNIDRNRFQIDFAVYTNPSQGYGSEMRDLGSKIWIVPQFNGLNYFKCLKVWSKLLTEETYDIIHGHATNAASIYLKVAKRLGLKTIIHSHSAGFRGNILQQFVKRIYSTKGKKYADYWFSCSELASKKLYGSAYKDYKNYYQMPNAINVEKYHFNSVIRSGIRQSLGIGEDQVLCGHVGSFSMPKNHSFLFKIFSHYRNIKPTAKLVLCGDGPLKSHVLELIEKEGLKDSVIMVGNIPNVPEYMMAMDILIFPSLFEGLPVTIVEAQATGLPVVMSDVITPEVNLTDIVRTCSLNDSVEEWCMAMQSFIIEDRGLYNKIISSTDFNMKESIKTVERLYESMRCNGNNMRY